jgi:hypothetical protein
VNIRALDLSDMRPARALLAAAELPTDDLDDASISLVGAFDGDVLVGVVGLQTLACCAHSLSRPIVAATVWRASCASGYSSWRRAARCRRSGC